MRIYIQKVRTEKKISLSELSKRSGVAVSHLYNIENGNKIPTIRVLCDIAEALDVPCSELYSCDDE